MILTVSLLLSFATLFFVVAPKHFRAGFWNSIVTLTRAARSRWRLSSAIKRRKKHDWADHLNEIQREADTAPLSELVRALADAQRRSTLRQQTTVGVYHFAELYICEKLHITAAEFRRLPKEERLAWFVYYTAKFNDTYRWRGVVNDSFRFHLEKLSKSQAEKAA